MNISKQTSRIAALPAVLIAIFAAIFAAHAGETIVGTVPFKFTVGSTTFPAGEYQFQVDQIRPDTVRVLSANLTTDAVALSHKADGAAREATPSLRFNVYGDQRFLSTIQTSRGTAVTLGQGSQERALAKVQAASAVASSAQAQN